jgi:dihydroorotate dehydrogenase
VQAAREIIDRRQLGLALVGVGGVMCAQHVVDMLAAGADVVQSATGMMWHPLLAHEYHELMWQQQQQRPPQKHGQQPQRELQQF